MECIEIEARALKPSFLVKANSELFQNDDVWCFAGINSVPSDDFPIEELLNLDFPEKDTQEFSFSRGSDEPKAAFQSHLSHSSSNFSGADEFDSLSASVPVDDVENLEWLSQFVDDSALDFKEGDGVPVEPLHRPVHRKPRSKRSRPQRRAWSSPPPSAAEQSFVSSSGSTSAFAKPVAEKHRRKPEGGAGSVSGRRCSHCQVQKTPQWRTGPVGPKTLCNACGVRFKSGRLFPEYRPACSPTFLQDLHSNSHRKVLEMRQKKEVVVVVEPDSTPAVQSQ